MAEEPELDFNDDGDAPPEESSNRMFLIIAAILVGMFVLGLGLIGAFAFFILPGQRVAQQTRVAVVNATNTQMVLEATGSAMPTNTPEATATATQPPPSDTPGPTNTPVVASTATPGPPTDTPAPPSDTPEAGTPGATSAPSGASATPTRLPSRTPTSIGGGAAGTITHTPTATRMTTATALPATGFADEAGLPGLIVAGLALVAVVVLARQLRLRLR